MTELARPDLSLNRLLSWLGSGRRPFPSGAAVIGLPTLPHLPAPV